jgi:preprotein translocase subunit SecG
MISVFIGICTVILILVAVVLALVVLAQRASSDAGMSAMGGGMMESTFGPDTSNVLSRLTIRLTVAFFVLSFLVYLGYTYQRGHGSATRGTLPNIPVSTAPATPATATPQPTAAPTVAVPATAAPNAANQPPAATQPPAKP